MAAARTQVSRFFSWDRYHDIGAIPRVVVNMIRCDDWRDRTGNTGKDILNHAQSNGEAILVYFMTQDIQHLHNFAVLHACKILFFVWKFKGKITF